MRGDGGSREEVKINHGSSENKPLDRMQSLGDRFAPMAAPTSASEPSPNEDSLPYYSPPACDPPEVVIDKMKDDRNEVDEGRNKTNNVGNVSIAEPSNTDGMNEGNSTDDQIETGGRINEDQIPLIGSNQNSISSTQKPKLNSYGRAGSSFDSALVGRVRFGNPVNKYSKLYSFDDRANNSRKANNNGKYDDDNDADVDDDDYEPIDEEIALIWERDMRRKRKEEVENEAKELMTSRRLSSIASSTEDEADDGDAESTVANRKPSSILKMSDGKAPLEIPIGSSLSIDVTSSKWTESVSPPHTVPLTRQMSPASPSTPQMKVASTKIVLMKATLEKKSRMAPSCIRKASSTSCIRNAQMDLGIVTKDIGAV